MRYSNVPVTRALLVLFLLCGPDAMASESSETGRQLAAMTMQEAVTRALANNPGIRATKLGVDIQQARRDAGTLSTPYRLATEIENFGGTDSLSGFDSAETTLQLSKTLELGDKRLYRTELGDAEVGLAQVEATVRELELTAEVSRRYAELLRKQKQLDLVAESVAISSRTLEIVQRRVAAGRASEAEESSANVELSRTELIGERLQFEMAGLRFALASLWGSTNPEFTRVAGDISSIPPLPGHAALATRLAENPTLRRIATNRRILGARRRLAESQQSPDLQLSAGVRHLAATDDMAMVVSFSMPFGSGGRAEPLVRESDLTIVRNPMTQEDQFLKLQSTLFIFYQVLLATANEHDTLRDQIIPEAERAVQFYQRGFELGSYSLLELTAVQERLLALRGNALDAAASFHLTLIEIESLLGSINPGGALQ
jgi:cobalt-zinc-cadmium efflux system outer membrane protein